MGVSEIMAQFRVEGPEDELAREVFAHFGRAFYKANCLEHGIAVALLAVEWRANLKPPMTRAQYEAAYDVVEADLARLSMGPLVKRLLAQPDVTAALGELLKTALEVRNRLAHHYFWERAGEFMIVPEGQLRMIAECDEATDLFDRANAGVEKYRQPYRARHGPAADAIKTAREIIIKDALERLSDGG